MQEKSERTHVICDLRICQFAEDRGISRFAKNFALALAKEESEFEFSFLLSRIACQNSELERFCNVGGFVFEEDLSREGFPGRCDILLLTNMFHRSVPNLSERDLIPPALAVKKPRIVGVVYDFIPLLFENNYLSDPSVRRHYLQAAQIASHCDLLLAISDSTARDAVRFLGVPSERLIIIYGGVDREIWKPSHASRLAEIIYVGGDDFRKNLRGLIGAFARGRAMGSSRTLKLVIACHLSASSRTAYENLVSELGLRLNENVELTGWLTDEQLVQRVSRARISIFPSLYEGLGLPVLESYAVGTPVFGSNTSSIAELVHPDCQFDPASIDSIAQAIYLAEHKDELLDQSLSFGTTLLDRVGWRQAAKGALAGFRNLVSAPRRRRKLTSRPLAIVSCLAPEESGVAVFTSRAFEAVPREIHFFSGARTLSELNDRARRIAVSGPSQRIVYPVANFGVYADASEYEAIIFVFGNSVHNVPSLRAALRFRPKNVRRLFYLHDALVKGLLWYHYDMNTGTLRREMVSHYPESAEAIAHASDYELLAGDILGVRILIGLMGEGTILVNSHRARRLIESDLGSYAQADIQTIFHPIFSAPSGPSRRLCSEDILMVGHFGMLGPAKRPELLIDAVQLIAKRRPVRLLFAGYGVAEYLANRKVAEFVLRVENLDDAALLALMRGVDVAVQLRFSDYGQSSGVVRQLISVGKRPLVTRGTSDEELGDMVKLVPASITAEELATAILNNACASASQHVHHLSTKAYAESLARILSNGGTASHNQCLNESPGRQPSAP